MLKMAFLPLVLLAVRTSPLSVLSSCVEESKEYLAQKVSQIFNYHPFLRSLGEQRQVRVIRKISKIIPQLQ